MDAAPLYEHSQLHGRVVWVLAALSAAGVGWAVSALHGAGFGLLDVEMLVALAVVLMPLVFFGLPMLHHGRQALRVDAEGITRDGELIVAAERIRAVGVHVRRQSHLPARTHVLEGLFLTEYRIHGLGPVLVPTADERTAAWLWTRLRPVLVVVEPDEDQEWLCRDGVRVGRLVLTRDERTLVEALLAIAPQVDEPRQLLVPEVRPRAHPTPNEILPTDRPPVEDWSWADGTRVP